MKSKWSICPECHKPFVPAQYGTSRPPQLCCSVKCSRMWSARDGIPTFEDKTDMLLSFVREKIDELFKPK